MTNLALPANPHRLYDPMRYALGSGGKRIRPVMTLMCAELFGEKLTAGEAVSAGVVDAKLHPTKAVSPTDGVLDAALAVELFHTFTLIHDDIMDCADLRRGTPTVVKKWGANVAILSGDGMLIEAYKLLGNSPNAENVLRIFNQAAIKVCEGQQLDVDFEELPTITLEQYYAMVGRKTAELLAAAAAVGAAAAAAPTADVQHLQSFAYELGLAFQVQDDYLDCYATGEDFGKATGGDIIAKKKTFLFATTAAALENGELSDFLNLMQNTTLDRAEKIAQVKRFYAKANAEQAVKAEVKRLFDGAMRHLAQVGVNEEKKTELKNLAFAIMKRQK